MRDIFLYMLLDRTRVPWLVTLRWVTSDRNKVQVDLTFLHVSGFSFPVVTVELSIYSTSSPFPNQPLRASERGFSVYS